MNPKEEKKVTDEFVRWLIRNYRIKYKNGEDYRDPSDGQPFLSISEMQDCLWDEFAVATNRPQVYKLR